ncbi:MAG: putative porin [Phycisphaerae bacterium]|nr:putative porin [Phycisphaerae bacterium]
MRNWLTLGLIVVLVAGLAGPVRAQTAEEISDMRETVDALKKKLREQEQRLEELEQGQREATSQANEARQLAETAKATAEKAPSGDGKKLPGWLDNLKFSGDFRLRYQFDGFNWPAGNENMDRHRARIRLRFGFVKTWADDQVEMGFRLASGTDNAANSTSETLGGGFTKKPLWIDQAYARYTPRNADGKSYGFSIIGGKFSKPWVMNELFWSSNVNPEGVWAEYRMPKITLSDPVAIEPFVGAGWFTVMERSAAKDSQMYILEAGLRTNITKDIRWTLAANYQEWKQYANSGVAAGGNSSPLSTIPGMRVGNLSNQIDIADVFGKPLNLFGDIAYNFGEDSSVAGFEGQNTAYAVGARWGQNRKKGDWSLKYRYAYIEANSLPGAFVESDFRQANHKGNVIGAEYNLLDSLTIGFDVFLLHPVRKVGSSANEDRTVTAMATLLWKF